MIKTPYGEIDNEYIYSYLTKLTGRVFKILPMQEEGCETLESYVDSLVREIIGNSRIFMGEEMLIISGTLKGIDFNNHESLRSDVFKITNMIDKIKERVK
jgi:hypothetical protein